MTDENNSLDLTDEDREALAEAAEVVTTAAKKRFSLTERLQGAKLATTKVVVFLDLEAVAEWQAQEQAARNLAAAAQQWPVDSEQHKGFVSDMTEAEEKAEALRPAAMESALAIHMRAVPRAAFDRAIRQARKAYLDDSGQIPEDKQEAFVELQNELLLGQVVLRIVDSSGAEADFDRTHLGDALREALGVPQYDRVVQAFNTLMFNDQLAREATADPGF